MWTPTHVQVTVHRARNLIPKGKGGTNDCYVSIGLGKEKYQTSVKEKSNDPMWNEECDLPLEEMGKTAAHIRLKVYHKNTLGSDDFLGYLELPLSDYPLNETPRSKWYELTDRPGKKKASDKYRGELEVKVAFLVQSKSASTLSLNKGSSIMRTGSFRSITNLGEKLKLPKRGGSFKEKSPDDKEKKSKTLSVFGSLAKKKSGSKLSLGKSKEDLSTSRDSTFYDESDEGSVNLENFDADTVFKKVSGPPAKPARLSKSNILSQQQRLSASVPGLTLIKKDPEFGAMKAFPVDDDADSINEEDNDDNFEPPLTESNTPAPKKVAVTPKETFNFDDDSWGNQEDEAEEESVDNKNNFVRSSPAKKPAPPPPVPVNEPTTPVRGPAKPIRSPAINVQIPSPGDSLSSPSWPSHDLPISTPTLDSVISSIGLGNSSPLVAPKSPQLSDKDYSLDSSTSLRLSARLTATTPPSHRKLEDKEQSPEDMDVKNNENQDAGFSRTGSYRQPIRTGSKRVKRAASDADAKKPETKGQSDEPTQLSDTREMASSMGRLDDKDTTQLGRHGNTLSSSEESHTRSAHSIPEVIPEVESPTMEDLRSFSEAGRQREEQEREKRSMKIERKYSADGRQSSGDFPSAEHRLVLGEESKETRKSKSVVLPPEVLEQYADYSREELIRMVHQQKKEMERKQQYCKDLESYIDNLLVRVMETTPKLLQKPPDQVTGHPGFPSMTNGHHRDSQKIQARDTRY